VTFLKLASFLLVLFNKCVVLDVRYDLLGDTLAGCADLLLGYQGRQVSFK
jgi:hypothetical protein